MKRFAPLLLLPAALVALSGCGKGDFSQKESAGKANVFRYPIPDNPTTLDPGMVRDGDTIDILQNVFEGLVTWSTENKPVGALAENWDLSKDGRTYTFHLKKDLKFSNGDPVTADDFKWTFERNVSKTFPSPTATAYLGDIVGVNEKAKGTAQEISGIKVVDPNTLSITIDQPRAYFLGKLTYLVSAVLDKKVVPEGKEITDIKQMVGTGPYTVTQYEPNQITVLSANKTYHGGAPQLESIERPVIKDANARLNKFKTGGLDMVTIERQDIEGVDKDPALKEQLQLKLRPSIYYIGFGINKYDPFKNRDVRRAFAMAIDKKTIVEQDLGGTNKIANGIIPPGVIGYRDNAASIPYDPAGAKALLAKAGFPDASKMPPLEMRCRIDRPDVSKVAEAVVSQLKQNLGVPITLRSMEWRAYLEAEEHKELQICHMRWAADYLDPENFLSHMLSTTGPEDYLGYSNPQFDQLCAKADVGQDEKVRVQQYQQAEDIALQDAAWVPIYFQQDPILVSKRVSGLRDSLFGYLPHTTTKVTQ